MNVLHGFNKALHEALEKGVSGAVRGGRDSTPVLGLLGWVRNELDGSVLCEVEGDENAVNVFVDEVRRGPRFSRVDYVKSESVEAQPPGSVEFEIQ